MEKYSCGFTSTTAGKQITITCSNINVFWLPIFIMIGGHVGLIVTRGNNMPTMASIVGVFLFVCLTVFYNVSIIKTAQIVSFHTTKLGKIDNISKCF